MRSIRCLSRRRLALRIPSNYKSARKLLKTSNKRGKSSTLILNRLSVGKKQTSSWTNLWKVGITVEWLKLIEYTEELRKKKRRSESRSTDSMTNKLSKIMMLKNLHQKKKRKLRPINKSNNLKKMPRRKPNLKRNERSVQMLMKKLKTLKPLSQVLITASRPWQPTMVEIETIMSLQPKFSLKTKKKKSQNSSIKDLSPRSRSLQWTSLISTLMWMRR